MSNKLKLKTEALRVLSSTDLAGVQGGNLADRVADKVGAAIGTVFGFKSVAASA